MVDRLAISVDVRRHYLPKQVYPMHSQLPIRHLRHLYHRHRSLLVLEALQVQNQRRKAIDMLVLVNATNLNPNLRLFVSVTIELEKTLTS